MIQDNTFRSKVEQLMAALPEGKVTTYGDLAALAGHAHAARIVGGIAHTGRTELPWHRLVNRLGGLASGYHGGREEQAILLEAEGIKVSKSYYVVNFNTLRWRP